VYCPIVKRRSNGTTQKRSNRLKRLTERWSENWNGRDGRQFTISYKVFFSVRCSPQRSIWIFGTAVSKAAEIGVKKTFLTKRGVSTKIQRRRSLPSSLIVGMIDRFSSSPVVGLFKTLLFCQFERVHGQQSFVEVSFLYSEGLIVYK
jgi:hypothetical protein